ncbi:helix-turn-helix domain-containing protein [Actinoplanes sp. NBC_00393]|uniref:helix-turn-helix domain-containing protein n=1 Tax=Actinoplanes sp. NBC_00393 TaxID=2975953 RepID=UPI002E1ACCB7
MKDLAVRLAALDPDAGAALRVIAYFDRLTEGRAGLQAIVRGAAVLAGCPARLTDDGRRIHLRVQPDGIDTAGADQAGGPPDPSWMFTEAGNGAVLWLERPGPPGPVDAMVLERAAGTARTVLDRTRRQPPPGDPAAVELTLDAAAPEQQRLAAAASLGFKSTDRVRAVALADGTALLLPDSDTDPAARTSLAAESGRPHAGPPTTRTDPAAKPHAGPPTTRTGPVAEAQPSHAGSTATSRFAADGSAVLAGERAGIGPAGTVAELPASYVAARAALRFTADGTEQDPGPRVVHADQLGGLILLAATVRPGTEPVPDVRALDRVAAAAPWALATLDAVAEAVSLRAAAAALRVHHSTLQERLSHTGRLLGWDIREPQGRLRLQVALALHRLHRNPA